MRLKSRAVVVGIAAILAVSSVSAQESAPKWGAHVDVEAKPGTDRNIGEADFFLPLMQDGSTLFFGNARLRVADHDNQEGNFGLGVRRMLDTGWNIGGYSYYDRRRSQSGNIFNQLTFGAEALGQDFDFRGNVYLPQGDRVRALGTTTIGGASTAAIVGATVQVTTAGSTTFRSEEHALKGYDMEAGWRVPVWAVEADKQLRIYAGGYYFSDSSVRVSGPRVRAELAMYEFPALWKGSQVMLGAEYQDDNARGGQGFVSVRLRIPLGGEKDAGRKMNFQERRMTAPTVRDVDVVTQAISVVSATTPAAVETATALASGQSVTVLNSGTTSGAALPGAVAAAGANSTVILSGTFNTTAIITTQVGQTLMGAGTLTVRSPSGRTATLTTQAATVVSAVNTPTATIEVGSDSVLAGLTIMNSRTAGSGFAVLFAGVATGATVINNTITATGTGNFVSLSALGAGSNFIVSGNTLNVSVVGAGTSARALVVSNNTNITVTGNIFNASGASSNTALAGNPATSYVTSASTGNVLVSGVCASGGAGGSVSFTNGTTCP